MKAGEKLMGVDPDGRHPHAGGHDGDRRPVIQARIPLDPPDIIDQARLLQVMLRDIL